MKKNYVIVGELELQKQLEFLNEMKSDIILAVKDCIKNPSAKYLTIAEAAGFLKVSRSTIVRMIKNKDLIAMKAYKKVLIPQSSIDKLLIPINQ